MFKLLALRDQLTKIGLHPSLVKMASKFIQYLKRFQSKIKTIQYQRIGVLNPPDIVAKHFKYWSSLDHPNRKAFSIVINELNGAPANIVETGTSAWGTDSTRLWDNYVTHYGGTFHSVDIRSEPASRLKGQVGKRTRLVVSDSINFLKDELPRGHIDVFFLDSWDVDWSNPLASAIHGLKEFQAIVPKLNNGAILFVDDTPISQDWLPFEFQESTQKFEEEFGIFPGKGALILKELKGNSSVQILHHEYSVVMRFS
jgi:hypothetical protein